MFSNIRVVSQHFGNNKFFLMKEENNAACFNHRLLTNGTHAETVPTVPSTGLLIGSTRMDGSHSALSFNTRAFKH